jgi:hypothetical protein
MMNFLQKNSLFVHSYRPPSPNTQRKQQAPMNPPPPPMRPNLSSNAFGGNTTTLPAPMLPQYVSIAYSLFI